MEFTLPLIMTILSTLLTYHIATKKGLNVRFWVIMAIIFGLLVLPFVFIARNKINAKNINENVDCLEA